MDIATRYSLYIALASKNWIELTGFYVSHQLYVYIIKPFTLQCLFYYTDLYFSIF